MADNTKNIKQQYAKKNEAYPFPSRYGSHASMIVTESTNKLQETSPKMCVCKDEYGEYHTFVNRLDNGCADVARHGRPEACV